MSEEHTIGDTRRTAERRLVADEASVVVRKLVSKGERLEIDDGEQSVKLDALLLEGFSWQRDRASIDDRIDAETGIATDPAAEALEDPDAADPDNAISVSSEYAHVFVEEVPTPAGDALIITAPGRGSTTVLGVRSLRDLAAVEDTFAFSVWFRTPFGPEDTPVEGPL
jgi:hypothetical protein